MQTFWLPFITGLTGGASCFAVQGSLLTSAIATEGEIGISKRLKTKALIFFLLAKIVAYTFFGLLLGVIGKATIVSPKVQGWFQIIIGVYMLITAANLLNLHPFFKKFAIGPPKFIIRIARNQSKAKSFFTPIFLGTLTVFIPCGVTQSMMLLAVSAGNPIVSSLILFSFILGTIPVFFIIGLAATELFKRKAFVVVAAGVVAAIGFYSINSGQILRGSIYTLQNYWRVLIPTTESGEFAPVINGYQMVDMTVTIHGYQTNVRKLRAGIPVKINLKTSSVAGCSRAFTIPDYNISRILPVTGNETVEFIPEKVGSMTYTCSMGMYSGYFDIIK